MNKKIFIFLYFILYSLFFVFFVPVFEGPDEQFHLEYVNYFSKYHTLPNQYEGLDHREKYVGQGHQHPLYYIITGSLLYFFDSDQTISSEKFPNKRHVWSGGAEDKVPVFNHVYNSVLKSPEDKVLFYVLRIFSVFLSLINIFFIFKIAELFFKESSWIFLTTFFVVTLPQYAFVSSLINNDSLSNLISTISIFFMFKIFKDKNKLSNYILCGLFLGIALLTKKTLFFLIPSYCFVILFMILKNKEHKSKILQYSLILFSIAVLLSSWFFIRNHFLYGDFAASKMEHDTMQSLIDKKSIFSSYFVLNFFPSITRSFFGVFGWMNCPLPRYVFVIHLSVVILSIAGLVYYFIKYKIKNILILSSAVFILVCLGGIIYFNLTFTQSQGRYMFPVLSLIALLFSFGIKNLIQFLKVEKYQLHIIIGLTAVFLFIDLIGVITLYQFYYTPTQYL